jgi:hypothetical protein
MLFTIIGVELINNHKHTIVQKKKVSMLRMFSFNLE